MTGIKTRHGRRIRLLFSGAAGQTGELGGAELAAALRVREDLPRLSEKPAFSRGTGLSKSLCDWVLEKILGFAPVGAEIRLEGKRPLFFRVPPDLGNFVNDINCVIVRDQYDAGAVRDGIVVDAGANIGVFTLYALALGAKKIYAFEAVSETFNMLGGNLALNRAGGRVRAVNAALGARAKTARLKLAACGGGASMIECPGAAVNRGVRYSGVRRVKLAPLDALVSGRVDFIKIDVEGYEEEVLKGAGGLIRKHKPVLSFAAYHRKTDSRTLPKTVLSLRNDYKIRRNAFAEQDLYCS